MTWGAALPCCEHELLSDAVERIIDKAWQAQAKGDDARPLKKSELRALVMAARKELEAENERLRASLSKSTPKA